MSGDPLVANLVLRKGIMEDFAVSFRAAAVMYRVKHRQEDIAGILSTLADKMDLNAKALGEEAKEMAR